MFLVSQCAARIWRHAVPMPLAIPEPRLGLACFQKELSRGGPSLHSASQQDFGLVLVLQALL